MRKLLLIILFVGLGQFEIFSQPYSYNVISRVDTTLIISNMSIKHYVSDVVMNNLNTGEQRVVIDSGPDGEYTWDQTGTWFILRDKGGAVLYNFLEDKNYYLGEQIIQFGKILYLASFNRIYILSSYHDRDSAMITYFDLNDESLNEVLQLQSISEVTPFLRNEAFLSEDEEVIYYHTEDLNFSRYTSKRDRVTSFSTVTNQVIANVPMSSLSSTDADLYILNSGTSGKSVISSFAVHTDSSYYQLYDFDSGCGYAIVKYLHRAEPLFTQDGKYLFLAQTYFRDYQYFCNGKLDVFDAETGAHLKSLTIPTDAELFMYPGYDNQIFVSYTDSTSHDSYAIDVGDLFSGELQIESMSPTITITKTKDFTLTVYGSGFTKKSDVYFDGKKKKTKFISENELEAKIKDKDFKKEGTYNVHVSEKKVGRTAELEFTVYKDLPEKIIPVLNCVEELDKKKFLAWFGYENYNDGIVYLDGKENELKGGTKIKGKSEPASPAGRKEKGKDKGRDEGELPVVFMPGVHEKVFSVEFDKKKVTWELLKEKAEATKDSSPCED
ncbi:IPT/TIG domain-containing protein [Bacteroidota bacterium]